MTKTKTGCRFAEFSVHRSLLGREVNVNSVGTARALFLKDTQRRYRPLAALVRSALGHRVMIVADGDEWKRTHDAIVPHLQAAPVARECAPVIKSVAERVFDELAERSGSAGPVPAPIDLDVEPLMRVVIASVMGHVLFGKALSLEEAQYVEKTLNAAAKEIRGRVPRMVNTVVATVLHMLNCQQHQIFMLPREQRKAVQDLLGWIGAKLDQAQLNRVPTPLLNSLKFRFADQRPARQRRSILAEFTMMLIAGIETTAAALTFAIAEIAGNPSVRDEVIKEARREADTGHDCDVLTVQYPYLYHVFRETLRRHTIVPTMLREAETDQELPAARAGADGRETVKVTRGCVLRYLPVQGNMRRSIWERPHRFDPGRFARPLTVDQRRNHHMFGLGPQSCPGRSMAITEAILILKAFFERLDIEHKEITQSIPVERNALLTIRPVGVTAKVIAVPRRGRAVTICAGGCSISAGSIAILTA
ncbi:MAG: cytochrome P450 [Steroidobacteraceae bacterium]